ncbi:MAG: hypothetical protein ABW007_04055 [Chitinophagaceae bacterium]
MTDPQLANLIEAISAIATVSTLVYAIRQGIKNSKKINDLAEITKQLSEQNGLTYNQILLQKYAMREAAAPQFTLISATFGGVAPTIILKIAIQNKGKVATVTETYVDSEALIPIEPSPNLILRTSDSYAFKFQQIQKAPTANIAWTAYIYHEDFYNNKYEFKITGKGNNVDKVIHNYIEEQVHQA